jgi:hypothetical protein
MPPPSAAVELLHEQITDADAQWSLGTFGGIAEFSRDRDEKVRLTQSATGATAVTARGGIAVELSETDGHSRSNASPKQAGARESPFACRPTAAR